MDCAENIGDLLEWNASSEENSEDVAIAVLRQSLIDPDRICPVLSGPAQISGNKLALRHAFETIRLTAPRHYLSKLFSLCQGDLTLSEINRRAADEPNCPELPAFIKAMLDAGVLIDASSALPHYVRNIRTMGLPATKSVWRNIRTTSARLQAPTGATHQFLASPKSTVSSLLAKRRSASEFSAPAISEAQLRHCLTAAYGVQSSDGNRAVASAGAAYSIDIHLVLLQAVGTVDPGLYSLCYDINGSVHLTGKHSNLSDVSRLVNSPVQLRNATGMIILSANPLFSSLKYRSNAYPFALLEAGAITQNISLVAAEQNFGWRNIGGIEEAALMKFCGFSTDDHILITGIFGSSCISLAVTTPAPVPKKLEVEFAWADEKLELPFYMAMARISDGEESPALYCWGRDRHAQIAHDKAVAEAAERYAYSHLNKEICSYARLGDMPGMIHPDRLIGFANGQYRTSGFPFKKFDPDHAYLWVKANDVGTGELRWIPADCCYANSALPSAYAESPLTYANSSGCASHTSLRAAQDNAMLEVIERDAFMQHWFAQRGGLMISNDSLPRDLRARIQRLENAGCRVFIQVLDLGQEPVWMCFIQHAERYFTSIGSCAGLLAEASLESAVAEAETGAYTHLATQSSPTIAPKDVLYPHDHVNLYATKRYFQRANALLKCTTEIHFNEARSRFQTSSGSVLLRLQARQLEAIWIDMSLPGITTLSGNPLLSGRLFIPGLIPIAFGNKRLPAAMDHYRLRASKFPHPFP